MKKTIVLFFLLLGASSVDAKEHVFTLYPPHAAQTPTPSTIPPPPTPIPFDPTALLATLGSNSTVTNYLLSSVTTLGQNQAADRVTLAQFTDQSATINTLRGQLATLITQLAADEARITALETKLAATQSKVAAAGTTLATP